MILEAPTLVELFSRRQETDAARPALAVKRNGAYVWQTWEALAADVYRTVGVLLHLSVAPGDRVAQVSENRYEWIVVDLAIQLAGAIHVPIHAPLTGPQIEWQIRHSGAKVVFLSGPEQAGKLAALAAERSGGPTWVAYDPCPELTACPPIPTLAGLQARADRAAGRVAAERARAAAAAEALVTILYTSGTTGEPKGVMLTHGNLASNAIATVRAFGGSPDQVRVNFLPLSHIFARTCDLYIWIVEGSRLALAQSRETVIADCQAIQPTCLNGVPYFYDKAYRALVERGRHEEPGALRALFGGAIERCCAGGAALPPHLYDYYHAQGVPLLEGYGLSESSPVITISTPTHHRRGSCGRAIPGVEIRIADDGEILTRGPHVMQGYYQNPRATEEVIRDGWLATGDLGRLDDDGYLFITGRKKEILVTSGGKNIAPVYLESLLTQDPLILQAMVVGDGRSCLGALIVPNRQAVEAACAAASVALRDGPGWLTLPEVLALFRRRIDERLACVSHYEQVRKFVLLARPFSIEAGELTPKLSLRRKVIEAHYAAEIDALYADR